MHCGMPADGLERTFGGDAHPFRGLAWTSTMPLGRGHAAAKITLRRRGGDAACCSGTAERADQAA